MGQGDSEPCNQFICIYGDYGGASNDSELNIEIIPHDGDELAKPRAKATAFSRSPQSRRIFGGDLTQGGESQDLEESPRSAKSPISSACTSQEDASLRHESVWVVSGTPHMSIKPNTHHVSLHLSPNHYHHHSNKEHHVQQQHRSLHLHDFGYSRRRVSHTSSRSHYS